MRTAILGGFAAVALALPAAAQQSFVEAVQPRVVPGEYIVSWLPGPRPESLSFESAGARVVADRPSLGFSVVRVAAPESTTPAASLERLGRLPGVRAAVPNVIESFDGEPGDPLAKHLWMIPAIGAAHAWAVREDASEIVVAVIDSGVYLGHEDIADNLWTNPGEIPGNGVDDDGNGLVDDVHGYDFGDDDPDPNPLLRCSGVKDYQMEGGGHGTHVAGTIGAVGGNGVGVIGVAPRVRIMALKVASEQIESCSGLSMAARLRALAYAIENGAKIVNMSLGGAARYAIDLHLLEQAAEKDVLVVVSAGNSGIDNDAAGPHAMLLAPVDDQGRPDTTGKFVDVAIGPSYPASWDTATMLSVAATRPPGEDGAPAFVDRWAPEMHWNARVDQFGYDVSGLPVLTGPFRVDPLPGGQGDYGSSYGARRVHIAAPGQLIVSAAPAVEGGGFASGYAVSQGTSMAAPAVAGAAALLWAAFPDQNAVWIKQRLMQTVQPAASLQGKVLSGGQLDLYAALCAPGAPSVLAGCEGAGAASAGAPVPASGTAPAPLPAADPAAAGTAAPAGQPATGMQNLNEVIRW